MRIPFLAFWLGFLLLGCSSVPVPVAGPTHTPAATAVPLVNPAPSPTDIQLPFNPNTSSDEYCKPPYALMKAEENDDISENEIVYELVKIWLNRYNQPNAPLSCRIDGYTIDNVYEDPVATSKVLEPRGDFRRVVKFSVKLIQLPSDWMGFAGELDRDNWLHVSHIVAITKRSEGYNLEFAYP